MTRGLIYIIIVLLSCMANAQENDSIFLPPAVDTPAYVYVRNISILGNKKTKPHVIERELTIKVGSRIHTDSIMAVIEKNRLNVFNLKIFNGVSFNIRNWEHDSLDLDMIVYERWYIIPFPIFKLADRNFNVWVKEYDHSFKRVQYGGMLIWDNFRGRDERLRIMNTFGFFQTLDIEYQVPHLTRYGKLGADFYASYFQSRRYAYTTLGDKQQFLYPEKFIIRNAELISRFVVNMNTHTQHYIESGYGFTWIHDTMAVVNPDYLLDGTTKQNRLVLGYEFVKDYRNFKAYPLEGWYFSALARNYFLFGKNFRDLGLLQTRFSRYVKLAKKHYTAHQVKLQVSVPNQQPYFNQRALGYEEDYVRGYEYYLIDGQHFLLSRNSYRFKLLDLHLGRLNFLQKTPLGNMPLLLFLNFNFDAGYVWDHYYDEGNPLRNTLLVGFGAGLDIVTFGEGLLRLEYTLNKKLEKGLYFHVKLPI